MWSSGAWRPLDEKFRRLFTSFRIFQILTLSDNPGLKLMKLQRETVQIF